MDSIPENEPTATPSSSALTTRIGAVLAVLFLLWGLNYIFHTSFELSVDGGEPRRVFALWDDGMISMEYARNLARGEGLVWNPGEEPVQGFSNLGVTLFMTVLHLLPVSRFNISLLFQLTCLATLMVAVWMAYRLARAMVPEDPWVWLLAAVSVGLYAPLSVWGLQGSDVGPATLVTLWAFVMVAERRHHAVGDQWPKMLWLLLAAGVLLRPDMTLLYAVFLAYGMASGSATRSDLTRGGGIFAIVWIGLLSLGYFYYGDLLPNTYYLKATGSPKTLMLQNGLSQLWQMSGWTGVVFLTLGVVCFIIALRSNAVGLLAFATVFVFFSYNVWIGGDWAHQYHSRFIVPVASLYLVIFVVGVRMLCARLVGEEGMGRAVSRAAVIIVSLSGLATFFPRQALEEYWLLADETMYHDMNRTNAELALFLQEATVPGTSVAFHWAGTTHYFSERPGIDVLGKSDRHIAKLEVPWFIPAHSKWDWEYVVTQLQPDIMLRASRGLGEVTSFSDNYVMVRTPRKPDDMPFAVHKRALDVLVGDDFSFFSLPHGEPIERPVLPPLDVRW